MNIASVMLVFGFVQLLVGALMLRAALEARAQLKPWRGRLLIAASATALGTSFVLTRGEVQTSSAVVALCCIIGFTAGSVISIREAR